jgi:aspartyl-tRNA(Asn)/glutamyl-tRNA(Gln) amidotransferase subunit C
MPPDHSPSHPLSADEVRKVARLSRLAVTDEQVETYRAQLSSILTSMNRLRELDLTGVEPLAHVGGLTNRLAPDEPGPTLSSDVLMEMAPATMPPFIKVPKVIDDGASA